MTGKVPAFCLRHQDEVNLDPDAALQDARTSGRRVFARIFRLRFGRWDMEWHVKQRQKRVSCMMLRSCCLRLKIARLATRCCALSSSLAGFAPVKTHAPCAELIRPKELWGLQSAQGPFPGKPKPRLVGKSESPVRMVWAG